MDKASETLFALKPVAFRYKKDIDPAGTPQLGLVAEEVEKVNPDLVVRDKEGKAYSVRYEAGERDVAQRVPQRASKNRGTASDNCEETSVLSSKGFHGRQLKESGSHKSRK